MAVAESPPQARFVTSAESDLYASKANRIAIHHRLGQVVAVIEIISPGNKCTQHALRSLVEKAAELLRQGISLLVVDLFPPSPRDPQGIHKAIWDEIRDEPFQLPADKPLTVAAYSAGEPTTAYVEPVAVGDPLPRFPSSSTRRPTCPRRWNRPIKPPGRNARPNSAKRSRIPDRESPRVVDSLPIGVRKAQKALRRRVSFAARSVGSG